MLTIKSRFIEMFDVYCDETVLLKDLSELITKGTTPTTAGYDFVDEGITFVKIESIAENGGFIHEKFAYVDEKCHSAFRRSQLKKNDLLFSIAGAIGRVAVVEEQILPANTNQALAIIRIHNNVINIDYLSNVLKSDYIKKQYYGLKRGAAQLNLSLENVSNFRIPLAPINLQNQFAAFVKQVDKSKLCNYEKNILRGCEICV